MGSKLKLSSLEFISAFFKASIPGGTVLPNGVKVAVWDLSPIFQKWKEMVLSCTLHSYWMNLVKKWTTEHTEFINLDKIHDCITLGFAENGYFTNKKFMEKLT